MTKHNPKVLIVFGTRPELIKLAPVISKIEASNAKQEFLIVSTAQHIELIKDQLDFWEIKPDITFLPSQTNGNLTRLLALTLLQLQDILEQFPSIEYIIVQGDTNTALACANLSFLNQKKLVHIEAGLRTYDLQSPFPEEYNRTAVSKVAYFHFVPSEKNRQNLLHEGVNDTQIMVTGNTIVDAMHIALEKTGLATSSEIKNDVIITLHRRENAVNFTRLIKTIERLNFEYPELNFIWVTHPNYSTENIYLLEQLRCADVLSHLPYIEFIKLYRSARFVITDSGGITEESSQLGIPVVVYRRLNDRAEPFELGHAMLVSQDESEIQCFFEKHLEYESQYQNYFGDGTASQMIFDWIENEIKPRQDLEQTEILETVIIGGVGSSRVDLQACKLEYSIVSPK